MSDAMTSPSLSFIGRKPGRPRAAEPGVRVSTWVPESQFNALTKYALKHDRSMSALLKEALERFPPIKSSR